MQDTNRPPSRKQPLDKSEHDTSTYEQRIKAAGLDGEPPEDMDEFRDQFARRISMYLNEWHGCPELICRRNRGCMAPNNTCANVPELPPEEAEREWRKAQPDVYKVLHEVLAERGLKDD
jgi:hypothetical protein